MSDWCRNHFEITGKSPLLAVAEEWIKGETEPFLAFIISNISNAFSGLPLEARAEIIAFQEQTFLS